MRFKSHICVASAIGVTVGWADAGSAHSGTGTEEAGTVEDAGALIAAEQWLPAVDAQSAVDLVEKGGPVVVVLIIMSLLATTVIVFKPRKSNFTSPACSTYFILNCVTGMSERGSR